MPDRARSFPPIATPGARILILGSMPGQASLAASQYYAHPRNAFWPLMGSLFAFDSTQDYLARVKALNDTPSYTFTLPTGQRNNPFTE